MNSHSLHNASSSRARGFGRLAAWIRVARERSQLAGLSEDRLRDIGVDVLDASMEASRPFWDLPARRYDYNG